MSDSNQTADELIDESPEVEQPDDAVELDELDPERSLAESVYAVGIGVILPGALIHELSHYLAARILGLEARMLGPTTMITRGEHSDLERLAIGAAPLVLASTLGVISLVAIGAGASLEGRPTPSASIGTAVAWSGCNLAVAVVPSVSDIQRIVEEEGGAGE